MKIFQNLYLLLYASKNLGDVLTVVFNQLFSKLIIAPIIPANPPVPNISSNTFSSSSNVFTLIFALDFELVSTILNRVEIILLLSA